MIPIRCKVTITLESPFHYGGGKGVDGSSAYLTIDHNGKPYWPGSAFKGKVRHYTSQLIDSCKFEVTRQSDDDSCCCIVCRLLGSGGNAPGSVHFSDMKPIENGTIDFRTGNAIERTRRTAKDDFLFRIETAAVENLEGYITGYIADNDEWEILKEAIHSIQYIGGGSGRGLGWLKEEIKLEPDVLEETGAGSNVKNIEAGEARPITLSYTLTLDSPTLIGDHSAVGNYRKTQKYIPGSLIQAALARRIVQEAGESTSGKLNYVTPDCAKRPYPTMMDSFSDIQFSACLPEGLRFAPITSLTCKYEHENILYDNLLNLLASVIKPPKCPACDKDGRTERFKGFCTSDGFRDRNAEPDIMIQTRSAVQRHRGVAQDELLYSIESLPPGAKFTGQVSGFFDKNEFTRLVANGCRIGGKQSIGCGQVSISVDNEVLPAADNAIRQRIDVFNDILKKVCKATGKSYKTVVPITLLSDAIVKLEANNNDYMNAYAALLPTEGFRLVFVRAEQTFWQGFDTSKQKGFLNPIRQKLTAGAVFVLETDELTNEQLNKLHQLELRGIGERTDGGYGRVRIADEFHIKFAYQWESTERG